jgi:predicted TIM-barrel fold metal-dependent hydrolase
MKHSQETWARDGETILQVSGMIDIGPAPTRFPQKKQEAWPEGTVIVSADSHILEDDVWYDNFPPHLQPWAPRLVFENNNWDLRLAGKSGLAPIGNKIICELTECYEGMFNIDKRLQDLEEAGVDKELLFPQRLLSILAAGESTEAPGGVDLRDYIFSIHNDRMASLCKQHLGRLYFAAIPNYWDMNQTRRSLDEIKKLGPTACALMLPVNGRLDVTGRPIIWGDPRMAPFWDAVEQSGLPVAFHIGEGLPNPYPGAAMSHSLINQTSLAHKWAELVFGGVFDRNPGLKIVFVEGGIGWVPKTLHDADFIYASFQPVADYRTRHAPSWYWYNNCYATFTA